MLTVFSVIYPKKKNSKHEIDLLDFIVVDVILKLCWYLSVPIKELTAICDPHTTEGKVKVIIKKARRAKNKVGKRSKSKQLNKIEIENGKSGKSNLNKLPICRINHCCQSIISK